MTDLEESLLVDIEADEGISLERGLLILSGLDSEEEIERYTEKLDQIHNGFIEKLKTRHPIGPPPARKYTSHSRAQLLFEYLWNAKPRRVDGSFLLTDVIEAQLDPDINRKVGACVGLTSLYTVLGLREHLNLTILVNDSHILNRLRVDKTYYNIENTDPLGFDCDLEGKSYVEYPSICLLANVLNSRAMAQERLDNLREATKDYTNAIKINPRYDSAYNNRGNIKSKQKDYPGATEDYDRAIALNPKFVEAYSNRGLAKMYLGDFSGAVEDFDRATEINPAYDEASKGREIAKERLRYRRP